MSPRRSPPRVDHIPVSITSIMSLRRPRPSVDHVPTSLTSPRQASRRSRRGPCPLPNRATSFRIYLTTRQASRRSRRGPCPSSTPSTTPRARCARQGGRRGGGGGAGGRGGIPARVSSGWCGSVWANGFGEMGVGWWVWANGCVLMVVRACLRAYVRAWASVGGVLEIRNSRS